MKKVLTIETGAGHTNAVLSGQAFAFIGGPEHNAFAKAKGAELRCVVGCVDRGNVYYCAAKGQEPKDRDFASYIKGKSIAVSQFGGTPNSITRYLLKKWGLDAKTDVTLVEIANSAVLPAVKAATSRTDRLLDRTCSSRKASTTRSGASRSSTCRRSLAPTPTPPSKVTFGRNFQIKKEPEVVRGLRARHGEGVEVRLRRTSRRPAPTSPRSYSSTFAAARLST